jgi:hypothetical protein
MGISTFFEMDIPGYQPSKVLAKMGGFYKVVPSSDSLSVGKQLTPMKLLRLW